VNISLSLPVNDADIAINPLDSYMQGAEVICKVLKRRNKKTGRRAAGSNSNSRHWYHRV